MKSSKNQNNFSAEFSAVTQDKLILDILLFDTNTTHTDS